MKPTIIIINLKDNVAVALEDLDQGGEALAASGEAFRTAEKIPYSHKVALREIRQGEAVIKYGEVIGEAVADIGKGAWVHTHNLVSEDTKP
jgi:altronate dehydratase